MSTKCFQLAVYGEADPPTLHFLYIAVCDQNFATIANVIGHSSIKEIAMRSLHMFLFTPEKAQLREVTR